MAEWPEGIDMAALLAPIAGDAPAGSDLREDFSAQSTYYRLRDARAEARAAGAPSAAHAALEGLMAEPVIGRLLLRVLQHVIGFADFLELGFGRLVARIRIRVILLGELARGGLEFLLVGRFADAQNFVKVALGHE